MATTDARLAAAVLDGLAATGIPFAVLHNEDKIADGNVESDLDIVVGVEPRTVVRRLSESLQEVGLRPVLLWDYDVSMTVTVFLVTSDASEGVQLDLLCDPMGHGKYAARTGRLLQGRVAGTRWPTVNSVDCLAYLVRKRHVKGDVRRLDDLLAQARSLPANELHNSLSETFSPRVATQLKRMIDEARPDQNAAYPLGYSFRDLARRAVRLGSPVGFWVEVEGDPPFDTLNSIAEVFKRILPMSRAGMRPRSVAAQVPWLLSVVAPVRWRAGLYISGGTGWPGGDLRLPPAQSISESCAHIVDAMNGRLIL
jgi:hypothetical protein